MKIAVHVSNSPVSTYSKIINWQRIQLVVILIKMKVLPVKRRELLQTLSSIAEQVRNESGCLKAVVFQNVEDDNELLFIEEWSTQKDSVAHLDSDLFTVLMGAGGLMRKPPEVIITAVGQSTEFEV
ncbi:MAG: antibiotic biosynthesis monooxygenase family protein [Desulfofustis sp.]|jgi:quinol monooxygenase YgiN|nr:antibiotic biosynthesis monooxygenase family protein [Desulfofustis sp.]